MLVTQVQEGWSHKNRRIRQQSDYRLERNNTHRSRITYLGAFQNIKIIRTHNNSLKENITNIRKLSTSIGNDQLSRTTNRRGRHSRARTKIGKLKPGLAKSQILMLFYFFSFIRLKSVTNPPYTEEERLFYIVEDLWTINGRKIFSKINQEKLFLKGTGLNQFNARNHIILP